MKQFGKHREVKPSMRRRLFFSLGSIAAILILSGVISIVEYRRMSDYVSELIASNINGINLSQRLSDMTQEYGQQMHAVVLMDDITLMPDFDIELFQARTDSLKNSVSSVSSLSIVDTVARSFDTFMKTSLKFDEVFCADSINTGEWFFDCLQPCYDKFLKDIDALNTVVYNELRNNSADFDSGFYRSIMPGFVSVAAGILLVILLMYFIMTNYVKPIYRMSEGIDEYRSIGKRYGYTFDGDDQLANINSGITDLIEENIELKGRIKALRRNEY